MRKTKINLGAIMAIIMLVGAIVVGAIAWQTHEERSQQLHECTLREQGEDQDERFFSKGLTPSIEEIKIANSKAKEACQLENN